MPETFYAAFLIEPATDIPGQWVAHCLSLDVVTQGDTVGNALLMLQEAVIICVVHYKAMKRDPLTSRTSTPETDWKRYTRAVAKGEQRDAEDAETVCVAGVFRVAGDAVKVAHLRRVLRGRC